MLWREDFDVNRLSWASDNFSVLRSKHESKRGSVWPGHLQGHRCLQPDAGPAPEQGAARSGQRRVHRQCGLAAVGANLCGRRPVQTFDAVTPKVTLDYQWTPDLMTYATWAIRRDLRQLERRGRDPRAIALVPVKIRKRSPPPRWGSRAPGTADCGTISPCFTTITAITRPRS